MEQISGVSTAYRVTGNGPVRVLLIHALTGGTDAADRDGVKGWWGPVFKQGAPLDETSATVWTPNLLGSCYGTTWNAYDAVSAAWNACDAVSAAWNAYDAVSAACPDQTEPLPAINTRLQAEALAHWILSLDLRFDLLIGPSLGGMVGLELAYMLPDRFRAIGIIGCAARSDAWLWGTNEIQRAILQCPELSDEKAIALARRAAMLTFRTPLSLGERFKTPEKMRDWLAYHGMALAARFTRKSYIAMLDAMDSHDLGRGRGGLISAMSGIKRPLFMLAMQGDRLVSDDSLYETIDSAKQAGVPVVLDWIQTTHGHDSFLIEWPQVMDWLNKLISEIS